LRDELEQTRQVQQDEQAALRKKSEALQTEQANVGHQLTSQRSRIELAEDALKRATQLAEQGFVSKEVMQQKQAELLDQHLRQQALERDEISLGRELLAVRNDLESLPLRQRNQLAQVERQLANTEQEWTESEAKRRIAVTAPESGVATAATAEVGQNIDGGRPVVSIIPNGAQLQAHLSLPAGPSDLSARMTMCFYDTKPFHFKIRPCPRHRDINLQNGYVCQRIFRRACHWRQFGTALSYHGPPGTSGRDRIRKTAIAAGRHAGRGRRPARET
jgi:biotin carboxyl carrier protein